MRLSDNPSPIFFRDNMCKFFLMPDQNSRIQRASSLSESMPNRLLSIQSHPPPWFIHPMEFLSINKTPTKMTRQWLCHLVEPKDGVLPPRSSTTTADSQRAYIHNTTQKARQFWWRKSPNSAQLFIRPFGWSNIYWSLYTAFFKALKLQNLGDTNGGSNEILLSF